MDAATFTIIVIAVLALLLFFFIAIPLIFPKQADKLPDYRDPLKTDLEEERDALLRAIQELDNRADLKEEKREHLKQRYQAKAANVLTSLETRNAELAGQPSVTESVLSTNRSLPYGLLALLALMVVSGAVMGGYVLPRIGNDATVTTSFDDQLRAGEELKRLETAVTDGPTLQNRLALADGYWRIANEFQDDARFFEAATIYEQLIAEQADVPAIAHFRLGLTQFGTDRQLGLSNVEKAYELDPNDEDIMFFLAEAYVGVGRLTEAEPIYKAYLETDSGKANEEAVLDRISFVQTLAPKLKAVQDSPSEVTLMDLGDSFWELEQRQDAELAYGQVLMEYNRENSRALSRIGQKAFFDGNTEQAIGLLSAAKNLEIEAGNQNLQTLLFLGNAYFSVQMFEPAITAWENYVEVAGGDAQAGRVPSLIANAQARLAGEEPEPIVGTVIPNTSGTDVSGTELVTGEVSGAELYAQHCAACHGVAGQGGSGPVLIGNSISADKVRVTQIITNGKGLMPAFEFRLSEEEIAAIADFVGQEFGGN